MADEPVLEVGSVPDRKRKALGVTEGTVYHTLAYFTDDESYERFCALVKDGTKLYWREASDG